MIQQKICDIGNRAFQCYLVFINTILREGGVGGGGGVKKFFNIKQDAAVSIRGWGS